MKTISMYLRAAKTEAEDAGESTEGMANSVSELRDEILALTGNKVNIQIDEDTFKSTYQIIKELSAVWEDLTDVSQANILELIGGKRNSNVISSMLENFDVAEAALESSANAAGSALAENEKYLDSINGKVNQLKAAFETLSAALVNSDLVKTVVDAGTALTKGLTSITETLGALPTVTSALTAFYTLASKVKGNDVGIFQLIDGKVAKDSSNALVSFFDTLFTSLRNGKSLIWDFKEKTSALGTALKNLWNGDVDTIRGNIEKYNNDLGDAEGSTATVISGVANDQKSMQDYLKSLKEGQSATLDGYVSFCEKSGVAVGNLGLKTKLASAGVAALNTALNMLISLGVTLAINAIISAVVNLIRKAEEARKAAIEAGKAAAEDAEKIYDLANSYLTLSEAIETGTGSRSEYMSVRDELIDALGLEGKTVRELTGEYDTLTEAIRAAAEEQLTADISKEAAGVDALKTQVVKDIRDFSNNNSSRAFALIANGSESFDILNYLASIGYNVDINRGNGMLRLPNSTHVTNDLTFDQIVENYNAAEQMLSEVVSKYGSDNDVAKALSEWVNTYSEAIGDAFTQIQSLNEDVARRALLSADNSGHLPTSLGDFEKLRNEVIRAVESDKAFDDLGGTYSVEDAVDSVLRSNTVYSEYLAELDAREVAQAELNNKIKTITERIVDTDPKNFDSNNSEYSKPIEQWIAQTETLKKQLEALSDEDFEIVYNLVVNGETTDWEQIQAQLHSAQLSSMISAEDARAAQKNVQAYRNAIDGAYQELDALARKYGLSVEQIIAYSDYLERASEQNATNIRNSIKSMWSSEDFEDTKKELQELAKTAGGVTAEKIDELAESGSAMAAILEDDGMNAQFLAKVLDELASGNDGLSLVTADALRLSSALDGMVQKFDQVTDAKAKYDSAMSVEEKDTLFKSYSEAYEKLEEQFKAGTTNSNTFWAAAEYLFGTENLEDWGWSDGLDEIYAAMQKNKEVFSDADSAGAGFLERMYEMAEAGKLLDENGEKLLDIEKSSGGYSFNIDPDNIAEIARQMGVTEEAALACLKALSMWGDVDFYNITEVLDAIQANGFSSDQNGITAINIDGLIEQMEQIGRTGKEIYDVTSALQGLDDVELVDINGDIADIVTNLTNLKIAADDGISISVDTDALGGLMKDLGYTKEDAESLLRKLDELDRIQLTNAAGQVVSVADAISQLDSLDLSDSAQSATNVADALSDVNNTSTDGIASEIDAVTSAAKKLDDDGTQYIKNFRKEVSKLDGTDVRVKISVQNSSTAKKRASTDIASAAKIERYAGGSAGAAGGPALVGEEGAEMVQSGAEAYLVGANGPEIVDLKPGDAVYTARETKGILSRTRKWITGKINAFKDGFGNKGSAVSGGIFIEQDKTGTRGTPYKVAVDADTSALEETLKDTLDKLGEDLDDLLEDLEHKIFLLGKNGGTTDEIVAVYKKMQSLVHAQAEKYRKMGLAENSEYIQSLQKQWWEYEENIRDAIVEGYEKEISEKENLITRNDNLLNKAVTEGTLKQAEEYSANIIRLYREMQEKVHEEAEYYRSLGYSETSDELTELSSLWWDYADKVKEVKDNIVSSLLDVAEAASDAVDQIQNVYNTMHDAADEYASNDGFISVDTFQSILDLGAQYMQYLNDENGLLVINEENINKVIAAKTEQLALENAMTYVERLHLAAIGESNENLNELAFSTTSATNTTWGLVYAELALMKQLGELNDSQYNAALHNIQVIQSLAENAINGIGKVAGSASNELEDMKSGLDDILEYVMDMLKQRIEDEIDALGDMKDAYADLIALRKESLETASEEADYQDQVAEKIKEIAKLQERINALSLDDSRDAQAQRAKLEEELAELQKELADTQADYAKDAQQDSLDKMQDAYEKEKDEEIKVLEDSISSYQKLYDMAIDYIQTYWSTLYDELIDYNTNYGLIIPAPWYGDVPSKPHIYAGTA